jgi:hypothetical protein
MFKLLLIIVVILYLLYKIGTFFYRAGAAAQHFRNFQQKGSNGRADATQAKKSSKFKGGEYVDYEEVK